MNLLCPKTLCCPCAVKCNIAAAQDYDSFAHADLLCALAQAGLAQEINIQKGSLQVIALQRKPCPDMGADGHQYRVVFLQQLGRVLHLGVDLHLHAGIRNHCRLLGHYLPGQTVGGDAIAHHAAHCGKGLLHSHVMTLLAQIIGSRHACRASAHHADLLAGIRKLLALALPVCAGILLGGIALDVADGHGNVDLRTLALELAHMVADHTKSLWEGNLLPDHGCCLVVLALLHKTDVTGHVRMGRTGAAAGYYHILLLGVLLHHLALVPDGAGGADLGTGLAEAAVRILQKLVM